MFNRAFLFALGTIGAVAMIAPGLETNPSDSSDGADEGANSISANSMSKDSSWYAGGHTLTRRSDGHFYADGYVGGASVNFMVDTGASVIALTGADAQAVGLDWDPSEVRPIGSGASGTVYGVGVRLDQVEIGGNVQRNVEAVIIPEGLEISLLGQSFLSRIDTVEIEGDRMRLGS